MGIIKERGEREGNEKGTKIERSGSVWMERNESERRERFPK